MFIIEFNLNMYEKYVQYFIFNYTLFDNVYLNTMNTIIMFQINTLKNTYFFNHFNYCLDHNIIIV